MNMVTPAMPADPALDNECINTLRFLSVDAVQKADSRNPRMPMGPAGDGLCAVDPVPQTQSSALLGMSRQLLSRLLRLARSRAASDGQTAYSDRVTLTLTMMTTSVGKADNTPALVWFGPDSGHHRVETRWRGFAKNGHCALIALLYSLHGPVRASRTDKRSDRSRP